MPIGELSVKVTVKYFATLRKITGKEEEKIALRGTSTVKKLVDILSKKYGDRFSNYVDRQEKGDYLLFLVNGRNISVFRGFETKLKEGDSFVIMPALGGG